MSDTLAVLHHRQPTPPATATARICAGIAVLLTATLTACGQVRAVGPDDTPPVLRIGAPGVAAADAARAPHLGGRVVLDATLPSGPASAPTYRIGGPVDEASVRALARALGLDGAVQRGAHGWLVTGPGELRVRDDTGRWAFGADRRGPGCWSVDIAASASPDTAATCSGVAVAPGTAQIQVRGPDAEAALAIAGPVFDAMGINSRSARTYVGTPTTTVSVNPEVGGRPTMGVATTVTVDHRSIVFADGSLAQWGRDRDYPLIPARSAFDRIGLVRPMIAEECAAPLPGGTVDVATGAPSAGSAAPDQPIAPPSPKPATGTPVPGRPTYRCAEEDIVITGASLGLELRWDAGQEVLVPAWFFDVRGTSDLQVVVAVAPAYLAESPGVFGPPNSGGGSTGGSPGIKPPTGGAPVVPQSSTGAAVSGSEVPALGR